MIFCQTSLIEFDENCKFAVLTNLRLCKLKVSSKRQRALFILSKNGL